MSDTPDQASKTVPLLLPMAKSQPRADRELAETLSSRIRQVLRRSLHVRHLDAGSCNACDWEIQALLGPTYDIQRLGIDIVASPRHADALVLTGPVTRNMAEALERTWDAMPAPKIVIAVGACAISGGPYAESQALARDFLGRFAPTLWVPGCPPHPLSIVCGVLDLLGIPSGKA